MSKLTIERIKLAALESELMNVQFNIKKNEGIVNSPNIKNKRNKDSAKKKLLELIKEKDRLSSLITEYIFLDVELK